MSISDTTSGSWDKFRRTLITPEGIDLQLRLADGGARVGAFILDLLFMGIGLWLFSWALFNVFSVSDKKGEMGLVILVLVFFLVRNFYFTFFEMGPRAATPGKRLLHIRVAARSGGHLNPASVFARNAMRELEFFIPLSVLLSAVFLPRAGVAGWMNLLALIWSFIFLLFPLFNKDRLRAGDLIGGTWVVKSPRAILSKDIAGKAKSKSLYNFSQAQIDAYGIKELHVLENVLRKNNPKIVEEVTERIIRKIEWTDEIADSHEARLAFLNTYYAALRGKLETKLLFGVRRKDKFDNK